MCSLFYGTIFSCIYEHLKLRKVVARWVSNELINEDQMKRGEDCCERLNGDYVMKLPRMSYKVSQAGKIYIDW